MNGYLPVYRFYRLYRIVQLEKRETEGYDYQFDTLTNRPSPPSRLPEGDLKFTGKECTKEV